MRKVFSQKEMEFYTEGEENDRETGTIKNILLSNIRANVTVEDKLRTPVMITGLKDKYVEKVQMNNISITFHGGGTREDAKVKVPEDEFRYPEQWFFGVLPSYGIFARYINKLKLTNVDIELDGEDARKACVFENVQNLTVTNCSSEVQDND